jgi:hypothetical protein
MAKNTLGSDSPVDNDFLIMERKGVESTLSFKRLKIWIAETIDNIIATTGTIGSLSSTLIRSTTFNTNVDAAQLKLTATTLSADGSGTDIDVNINAKGAGLVYLNQNWAVNASGTLVPRANSTYDIGNGLVNPRDVTIARHITSVAGRIQGAQGVDVASANNLVLGSDGNAFEITGGIEIQLISNLSWQNGSQVVLLFTSNPVVKTATATSTTNITILLDGGADFTASAGDTLSLCLCEIGGVQAWREIGRTVL